MKRLLLAALTVIASASLGWGADRSVEVKSGAFAIQADVRAQANLIYHINCIAHAASCTSDVFERLWREELNLNDDDRKLLEAWASLRESVRRSSPEGAPAEVGASVPIFAPDDDSPWTKARNVEFVAADLEALKGGWKALMPAETIERLATIVEHFRPRFDSWWRTHEAEATAFVPGVEAALRKAKAAELLGAAARLYRSELSDRRLFMHVFLQPTTKQQNSRAGLVGAHLTVEIVANEPPEGRADVIIHELSHHLFARMPVKMKAWLVDEMLATGSAGMPAWNLFNEVQATVIGNMLGGRNLMTAEQFQKMLDRPQSFYADEAIDLGARAAEQVFKDALKRGGPMRPSFPKDFVAALKVGMGEKLETPVVYLREMVLNVDDDASPWFTKLRRAVRAGSIWTVSPLGSPELVQKLNRYPGIGAAVVVMADQVAQLAPASGVLGVTPEALTAVLGSSRGVVVISQRTAKAYSIVFVARDARAMDGLIAGFQYCQLKPGVCIRIQ